MTRARLNRGLFGLLVSVCAAMACTEADPIDPSGPGGTAGTGTAGSSAQEPPFTPYVPPGAPGAAGGGATSGGPTGSAGTTGPGSGGASGRTGPSGAAGTATGTGGMATAPAPAPLPIIPGLAPVAISDSGLIVAGDHGFRAARWSSPSGLVDLPLARPTHTVSTALAMSAEGSFIVGASGTAAHLEATIWNGSLDAQPLGFARAGDDDSIAVAVGASGKLVAGTSQNAAGLFGARQRVFIWRGGPLEVVPPLPGDTGNEAVLMSLDGSTIVGISYEVMTSRQRTFWWTAATGSVEVSAPDPATLMIPRALSADGQVLVGDAVTGKPQFTGVTNVSGMRAFKWSLKSGGSFAPAVAGRSSSRVTGISLDGGIVVGTAFYFQSGMEVHPIAFRAVNWMFVPFFAPPPLSDVPIVFTDAKGSTLAGMTSGAPPFIVVGRPAFGPALAAVLPPQSEAVALSGNGAVLLGWATINGDPATWLFQVP